MATITVSPLTVWADYNEVEHSDDGHHEIWVSLHRTPAGAFVQIGDPITLADGDGLTSLAIVVRREGVGVVCRIHTYLPYVQFTPKEQ